MEKNELWEIHGIFLDVVEYLDVDIEETEYYDHGTYPNYVHKEKRDHKDAIRLLSVILEEQTELSVNELETWHENYNHDDQRIEGREENEEYYNLDDSSNPLGK